MGSFPPPAGQRTCGAGGENVHRVAVRHENAVELLLGFGVTREVHSPVRAEREGCKDVGAAL